ncbi:hypothetical protein EV424DRAFT_1327332 [Suillus variegatus]|nr:hypothetical protein EV424DRAFT_1327332 [Suillus variegatus]
MQVDDDVNSNVCDVLTKKGGWKRLPRAKFAQGHTQGGTHILHFRKKFVVPVLLGNTIPRPDQSDEEYALHCRAMMVLFKPWQNLKSIKGDNENWTDAYEKENFPSNVLAIIKNMNVENKCKDAHDAHAALV